MVEKYPQQLQVGKNIFTTCPICKKKYAITFNDLIKKVVQEEIIKEIGEK